MRGTYYPKFANCTGCTAHIPYRVGSFLCDRCMKERATYSDDDLICEAPSGCARTVDRTEHLCHVHQAIADGLPPPLAPGHLAYALDRLPNDAGSAPQDRYQITIPSVGHVTMARRRYRLDSGHEWFEWVAVAA
jgi:hypothetical protein